MIVFLYCFCITKMLCKIFCKTTRTNEKHCNNNKPNENYFLKFALNCTCLATARAATTNLAGKYINVFLYCFCITKLSCKIFYKTTRTNKKHCNNNEPIENYFLKFALNCTCLTTDRCLTYLCSYLLKPSVAREKSTERHPGGAIVLVSRPV